MCNRYAAHSSAREIVDRFAITLSTASSEANYNIAPTDPVPVVVEKDGERRLEEMRWGLIPFSAKPDPSGRIPKGFNNARGEALLENGMYRSLMKTGRCILPANGFYEWSGEKGAKQPWYFSVDDEEIFGFAGLWSTWKRPEGEPLYTCTTITTTPNELCATVHNRMPVILTRELEARWLTGDLTPADVDAILTPFPADLMTKRAVGQALSDVRYKGPKCLEGPLETSTLKLW